VDLDLGAALGDSDATGEARPVSESGVDFVFDDAERGNEQTGSTREMPGRGGANTTVTVQVAGAPSADPDAPTLEQPQLPGGDHPTIRQKIDAATRGGMVSSEQTAELELHDLGLDLGGMDTLGDDSDLTSAADAPTLLAGLGDETRKLLTRTDSERSKDKDAKSGGAPTDSGTWLFTDTDFADIAGSPGAQKLDAEAPTEVVTQLSPRPELQPEGDGASCGTRLGWPGSGSQRFEQSRQRPRRQRCGSRCRYALEQQRGHLRADTADHGREHPAAGS